MSTGIGAWWEHRAVVALAAVLATMPLWFVTLPPLIDLLGHMGRYHIQLNLAENAALRAHWDFDWRLIGNLGADLLMEPLGRLFGVERGAVVLGGLLVVVMITGMARLARAAHGILPATAWAAFPFALAYPWHYGLVNYWLGIGLAFHAAAAFRRPRAGGLLALASILLWVVHIYGWAVFAVLVAAQVAAGTAVRDWPRLVLRLWPLGAPLVLMIALSYGQGGAAAATLGWFEFGYKALALTWTLRDQDQGFDLACLGAALLLIYAGFRSRAFAVDRGLALAALALLGALLVLPYQFLGSAFADARLWPVVIAVALLAVRPAARAGRLAAGIAGAAAALLAARTVVTTIGFQAYDAAFARHLQALDLLPRGARVAVFVHFSTEVPWRRPRIEHLDGIAIVRRDVFTNAQWEVPGAQLLVPLAARGTRYNADPSQYVMGSGDLRPGLARKLADFPRDRFDHVWVLGYRPETLPRYAGLTPVFADEATILYRIDR